MGNSNSLIQYFGTIILTAENILHLTWRPSTFRHSSDFKHSLFSRQAYVRNG